MIKSIYKSVILITVLLLVACGEPSGNELLGNRILLWHSWNETEAEVLDQLLDNFATIHPETTIIHLAVPPAELRERFEQRARLGLGPDLLLGPSNWIRELVDTGLIQDLSAHDDIDLSAYLSTAVETVRYQERLYGLPLSLNTTALYYNKELETDPPATLGVMLLRATEGKRIALNTNFETAFWGVQAFGGRLFDEEGRVTLNQGGFANWLGWLKNAQDVPNIFLDNDEETLYPLFREGQVAYYAGSSEVLADLQKALGEDIVGVAPLPEGPSGPSGPFLRTEAFIFNAMSSPRQTELALSLAQFLTNEAQQAKLARQIGRIPANVRVRVDARVYPALAGFVTQSKTAVPILNIPQMDEVQREGNKTYIQALAGTIDLNEAALQLTGMINSKYGFDLIEIAAGLACPTELKGQLQVWHGWNETESGVLTTIVHNFTRRCPEVIIDIVALEPDMLSARYRAAATQGRGPDLLIGPSSWITPLAADDLISDISSLIEPEFLQRYVPVAERTMWYQDRLYGLPESMQLMVLYYKADQVTDPVRELDDLLNQASLEQQVALPINFYQTFWGIVAFGGLSFDDEFRPILDEEGLLAWLEWLQAAQNEPGLAWSEDLTTLQALFTEGQAIYFVGETSLLGKLQAALGQEQVRVAPLPAGPVDEAKPFVTTEGLMLNPASLKKETQAHLAIEFAKYMTDMNSQTLLMTQAHHIPSNVNVDTSSYPTIAVFFEKAKTAFAYPNLMNIDRFWILGDTIYAEMLAGELEPEAAVQELVRAVDEINNQPEDE